ncbi:MAG TPA: anhydro-N-acetylmuramic acid kinase [Chitinophagales bacterium]|nr:anhydro-N-acetylmuramic acid kinase [Chitinophagales bacterium]
MSGSSLDGLDICYVELKTNNLSDNHHIAIDYTIIEADCIEYTSVFREQLREAPNLTALGFAQLHTEIGKYFGILTNEFIQKNKIRSLDFICSHGQTIFHQPNSGFTTQIGCGAQIAAQTNTKVICDLRTSDVAYGGQGAPIVPIAEKYLFPEFSAFLNIGGIANISFANKIDKLNSIIAYDVCAANTVLNFLAKQKNAAFDKDGNWAKNGAINNTLLEALNGIEFCNQSPPKSLGSEHVYTDWITCIEKFTISTEDKLATMVEHIVLQVSKSIRVANVPTHQSLFVSGGGALNSFLIHRLQQHSPIKVVVPDVLTVQYKEALAMATIGLLRLLELPNCLASVTGASKNSIGGAIYHP